MVQTVTKTVEELRQDSLIDKLFNEFEKARTRNWDKFYVFVDLHDTVLAPSYTGDDISRNFHEGAISCLQELSSRPDMILGLFTSSKEAHIEQYQKMFTELGIQFQYVNENPEQGNTFYADFSKKPYMSLLLDDKAGFNPKTHWQLLRAALKHLPSLEGNVKKYEIAAAVMRIQSHEGPHEGHMELISALFNRGKNVFIFLAIDRSHPSRKNPLPFRVRKALLEQAIASSRFAGRMYEVLPFSNHESSEVWSHELDKAIADHTQKPDLSAGDIVYINSRDGFGKHYVAYGIHPVIEIKEIPGKNATAIRESVLEDGRINKDVALGMMLQQMLQPEVLLLMQTRAIITNDADEVLVVRYHSTDETGYRFPGGYFSPKKESSSHASLIRKLNNKLSLVAGNDYYEFPLEREYATFIAEIPFSDWRHRESGARIICNVFHIPVKYEVVKHPHNKTKVAEARFIKKSDLKNFLHHEELPIAELVGS
jgi:hypothetical protein